MKTRGLLGLYMAMIASGAFMGVNDYPVPGTSDKSDSLTEDDIKYLKERADKKRKELLLKRGCQKFYYTYRISESIVKEVTVIALNKRNADKKYERVIKLWKESI